MMDRVWGNVYWLVILKVSIVGIGNFNDFIIKFISFIFLKINKYINKVGG